jgi:phenylacetate-CoA ligase
MGGMTERVYLHSPIWLQQCAVAAYGWWWRRRRFSQHFSRLVAEFKDRERWTAEQFHAYQAIQLTKVLTAAWRSPYYRTVASEAGVGQDMDPFTALRRMPLLTKETLRTKARELLTQNPLPKRTITFKSSGTTGTPTEIILYFGVSCT